MSIDYVSKLNSVIDILRSHNTTTASPDLSQSLTSRIQTITSAEPDVTGLRWGSFPHVMVELSSANENETQIGDYAGRRKIKTVNYNVWGFYRKEGIAKTAANNLTDFYKMASNIEAVIKRESTFSNTALHVDVVNTDFTERRENNMIKVLKIETSVRYFYQ